MKFNATLLVVILVCISACSSNPRSKQVDPMQQAKSYYDRALYSEAERILLKMSRAMRENYDVHFMLGNIYVRTGQFPAAELMYTRCIEIDSSEAKGWYNMALLKVKEAVALTEEGYRKSAVESPEYSDHFLLLKDGLIIAITGK